MRTVPDDAVVRVAGIGGTGVTTISQVLAAAARIDGRPTRGLDQTGLAQKGGAVVSDVKLADAEVAGRAASGECDLYLGADLLVAADPAHLAAASPERTVAVVSSAKIPTGDQVVDPTVTYPPVDAVLGRIAAATRRDVGAVLDARALAEALFGDDQFSLSLLLGAAHQLGALPLSADAVESAFELNGAAVATNVQAFRRGRQSVADPDGVRRDGRGDDPAGAGRGSPGSRRRVPRPRRRSSRRSARRRDRSSPGSWASASPSWSPTRTPPTPAPTRR